MELKEIRRQAYDLMLLNPNSEQYKQFKEYIEHMEKKSNIEETQKIIERIEKIRETPVEEEDDNSTEGADEYISFADWEHYSHGTD